MRYSYLRWLQFAFASALFAVAAAAERAPHNLLPNPELRVTRDGSPVDWTLWSPRPALAAIGSRVSRDGAPALSLRAERFETVGKWMTLVREVAPGKYYRFEVLHQSERIASEAGSVFVMLSWFRTADGEDEIQRDYVLPTGDEGSWRRSTRTLQAPAGTQSVRVELGLRWAPGGAAYWKDARLSEASPRQARKVRIAATRILPDIPTATIASNTQLMADMFDRVGPEKPDIVLFSENLATRFVRLPLSEKAQPVPGPLTDMLSAKAKKFGTYAITTLLEVDGPLFHNTAVLIDRAGRIVGKYRKVHLTIGETDSGLTPGTGYPVFDTDFGRIGIMTCWDNWFSEPARILRLNGAEMLFMPLAGDGQPVHWEHVWRARASDNGVWLITSATVTDSPSRIIDPRGEVVAEARGAFAHALAEIDLDHEWRVRWLSVDHGYGEAKTFYLKERRPDTYSPLVESASLRPGL